jgi:hypothetical protein
MNKLSKEKRNQLILVGMAFVGAVAGLWFLLISPQMDKNTEIKAKIQETQSQIDKVQQVAAEADQVEVDLKLCAERLKQIEDSMPDVDRYAWINTTLRRFNDPQYKVEMQPVANPQVSEVSMLPGFPYHQFTATLNGAAYFTDLARFMKDFENRFPYMRFQNPSIVPGAGITPEEREKLNFRVEIVALIKYP